MRRDANYPTNGAREVVTKFLIFPKTLRTFPGSPVFETRWLEKASWIEEAHVYTNGFWWSSVSWNDSPCSCARGLRDTMCPIHGDVGE